MSRVVGIDLGTTFSAVAYVDERGRPRIIPNADGSSTTPSAVLIQDGRIVVGEVALNQWVTNEAHVVRWIKRTMGKSDYRFQGLSPVQISAEILKALKSDAERHFVEPVTEAVITCPAYFAALEVENTKRAGELAGFRVREVVREPTAAAVYYGVENMRDGETILVCDLGGGTFDATILKLDKGVFRPLATTGNRQLGGHDWTMELVGMVAERFQQRTGEDPRNDPLASQLLYQDCERLKRDFARVSVAEVPCSFQGRRELVEVSRDEFEARTEGFIGQLVMWSELALTKAQPALTWKDIDRILLVGGSSRLRRMSPALEQASGKRPEQSREPDLMVALGAAILAHGSVRPRVAPGGLVDVPAGGLVEVKITRTIPRSLGTRVIAFEGDTPRVVTKPIIPHNTEAPTSKTVGDCNLSDDGPTSFDVPVVEYEIDEEFDVVGNYRFKCPAEGKRGDEVHVTFHYDESGIVTVEAVVAARGLRLDGERLPYKEPSLEEAVRLRVKPRWVVFAVDVSGSMKGAKLQAAKQALVANASDLVKVGRDGWKIGVVSFAVAAGVVCRPTSDLKALERAVNGMSADGTTAMDEGIDLAVELALAAPAGVDRDVVMLTDGMPDASRRQATLEAASKAKKKGVTLSSIGIGSENVDLDFLRELTPLSLVIDRVGGLGGAMTSLLTQSAAARAGALTDASSR